MRKMTQASQARRAALDADEATYEGNPCSHGHTRRYASSGQCVTCTKHNGRAATLCRARAQRSTIPFPSDSACQCCGSIRRRLKADSDPVTHISRGWICAGCDEAISLLGGTGEGVARAAEYLKRAAARPLTATHPWD